MKLSAPIGSVDGMDAPSRRHPSWLRMKHEISCLDEWTDYLIINQRLHCRVKSTGCETSSTSIAERPPWIHVLAQCPGHHLPQTLN